ncbi:MAG: bacteriocin fulvocin C-related protein [Capnocytophaga sp.]|nr:bacteriocin fulvocin C-related protein [Capnocytophaga sp.]
MKQFILVFATIVFFCSCEEKNEGSIRESEREQFVKDKTDDLIRQDFQSLPFDKQQELWVDKFNSLLSQDFSQEIKTNIKVLKIFVEDGFKDVEKYEQFRIATVNLASLVPKEDFVLMFNSLEDYNFSGEFSGTNQVPVAFLDYINTAEASSVNLYNEKINLTTKRNCNCRWCLFVDKDFLTTNCTDAGDKGCGFLWLQSCDKATFLFEVPADKIPETEELDLPTLD